MSSIFYRRPQLVRPAQISTSEETLTVPDTPSRTTGMTLPLGIPDALSFDNIIEGKTCPPCTTRDFMNYCLYIEHTAENLQFFLWLRNYTARFENANASEKVLSRPWTVEEQEATMKKVKAEAQEAARARTAGGQALKSPTIHVEEKHFPLSGKGNPFSTPPATGDSNALTQSQRDASAVPWDSQFRIGSPTSPTTASLASPNNADSIVTGVSASTIAGETFASAGLAEPFTIQPFRQEIDRIVANYFSEDAPRELNLDGPRRKTLLIALQKTTHPSAFFPIRSNIEETLRYQLHPNFIRWTICNGNRPRQLFAIWLGIACINLGILIPIILILSRVGRGWRAWGPVLIVLGVATLNAGAKGMCVVLHGLHKRHMRPWELFAEEDHELADDPFEPLGGRNSYEDKPWVVTYEKRTLLRKIFDREVWIQEPALKSIQNRIFWQSIVVGLMVATVPTVVFLVVPSANKF